MAVIEIGSLLRDFKRDQDKHKDVLDEVVFASIDKDDFLFCRD